MRRYGYTIATVDGDEPPQGKPCGILSVALV
jgi:hypothetical protein